MLHERDLEDLERHILEPRTVRGVGYTLRHPDAWGDLSTHIRGWLPTESPYAVPLDGPPADQLPLMPLSADAHAAIETLIFTYAERHDVGDADAVGRLFAHGPRRNGYDGLALGGEELAAVLRHIQRHDGSPRTKHVTTNVLIEVDDGAASASVRSYFTVLQATRSLPLQVIAAGRYHDRFERVDGDWRFAERVILLDLRGDLSQHAGGRAPLPRSD